MRVKMLMFLIVSILSTYLVGCSNISVLKNQDDETTNNTSTNEPLINTDKQQDINSSNPPIESVVDEDDNIIPTNLSETYVGRMDLDSETEKAFFGTWKVEKLLGFANSWNDASEYPTGQKIIDDEIVINKDFFSSKGLKNYTAYQCETKNPLYEITAICYNYDSFYRFYKMELSGAGINDEIKSLEVTPSYSEFSIPGHFLVVNNDRLLLVLEATVFELKKVTD